MKLQKHFLTFSSIHMRSDVVAADGYPVQIQRVVMCAIKSVCQHKR